MESVAGLLHAYDADVIRKVAVQGVPDLFARKHGIKLYVRTHTFGRYTAVGPARGNDIGDVPFKASEIVRRNGRKVRTGSARIRTRVFFYPGGIEHPYDRGLELALDCLLLTGLMFPAAVAGAVISDYQLVIGQ